jgi:hypothetical protein
MVILRHLALSHAARNLAIASSRVAAVPCVAGDAGTFAVIDQPHRSSGGVPKRLR